MNDLSSMAPYIAISLSSIFVASLSQVLLKKAAMKQYDSFLQEYLNPLVIFAYFFFFTTTVLGVFAYKGIPVSLGPVLETTSYFYVTFFGVIIFKEKLNKKKIFALALIITGVLIYALLG